MTQQYFLEEINTDLTTLVAAEWLKRMRPISNRKRPTMEIEQRNKLTAIVLDIKDKIKDEEYKRFMDILGKKEPEPNLKNIRLVKLYFQHYEVHDRNEHLTSQETDHLLSYDSDCDCDEHFTRERLTCAIKTQLLEVYGNQNDSSCSTFEKDWSNGRIHFGTLRIFIDAVKNIDEHITADNRNDQLFFSDACWIHPLKYTVMD
jgi:hypothetical protein